MSNKYVVTVLVGVFLIFSLIYRFVENGDGTVHERNDPAIYTEVNLPSSKPLPSQLSQLRSELVSHLETNPVELDRALATSSQLLNDRSFEEAADLIAAARKDFPDTPDLLVRHAEALAGMSQGSLEGEPFEILSQSLDIDHRHKPSLWLMAQFNQQIGNQEAALIILNALKREMGDESEFTDVIDRSIAMSIMHMDGVEFETLEEP